MSSMSVAELPFLLVVEGSSHYRGSCSFPMVGEPRPGIDAFKPTGCVIGVGHL